MHRLLPHVLVLAIVSTGAGLRAQFFHTIPRNVATTVGNSGNAAPWGTSGSPWPGLRLLACYDSTNFTGASIAQPIVIRRLRWRADNNSPAFAWAGGTWTQASVRMSTAAVDHNAVSTTFANNHGPDLTTVYTGPVTALPGNGNGFAVPGPFVVDLTLTTPFVYDPALGDLAIDCEYPTGGNFTGGSLVSMDVDDTPNARASRVLASSNYPAANFATPNHGVVVELEYHPVAGLHAWFGSNVTAGAVPLTVQFTDQSHTSGPGPITSWAWDLDGDGITDSTAQNPSFVYPTCGDYQVSLTVTDATHAPQTCTRPAYIRAGDASLPDFTAQWIVPGVMLFTDASSPPATSWAWDLDGDGITDSTLQNPVHTYATQCVGVDVRLTVMRDCRGPSSVTKRVAIAPRTAVCATSGDVGEVGQLACGNLLDIAVTNPSGINVCAVSVRPFSLAGPFQASVFVTPDTYVGKQMADWRLLGSGTGTCTGTCTGLSVHADPTIVGFGTFAYLPPGNYGLAVYVENPNGPTWISSTVGTVGPFGNADVTFVPNPAVAPGLGSTHLFSSMIANRTWNGALHYSTIGGGDYAGYGFFGHGCAGTLGITRLQPAGLPQIGTNFDVNLDNLAASAAIVMLGFSRTTSPFGTLPVPLAPFGAPGCHGRVSPDSCQFVFGTGPIATWRLPIPLAAGLIGTLFYQQALVLDPARNALGAVTSEAAGLLVGH